MLKDALSDLDEAARLDPSNSDVYFNRGSLYEQRGDFELAISDFDVVIQSDPEAVEAYKHRGEALLKLGKRDAAIDDFRQVLKLDSTDEESKSVLGSLDALP